MNLDFDEILRQLANSASENQSQDRAQWQRADDTAQAKLWETLPQGQAPAPASQSLSTGYKPVSWNQQQVADEIKMDFEEGLSAVKRDTSHQTENVEQKPAKNRLMRPDSLKDAIIWGEILAPKF